MLAFLSYSAKDSNIVDSVAKRLGRQYCIVDKADFDTGCDFRDAIREGLDRSTVLVLFASRHSIERTWVRFEIDEAEYRKIHGQLEKILVFLVDSSLDYNDLPDWLQRVKATKEHSPAAIVREIQHHMSQLIRLEQSHRFVNRSTEQRDAEVQLVPFDGSSPPRVVLYYGLQGIGRRTLCNKVAENILRLPKSVYIPLESGDSLADIGVKLAQEVELFRDTEELKNSITSIRELDETEQESRISRYLSAIVRRRELPVFVDKGGFVSEEGVIREIADRLLGIVNSEPTIYAAIISTRRPRGLGYDAPRRIATIRVNELTRDDIKRLLLKTADDRDLHIDQAGIQELSKYIGGYPPAANYAIELAKHYGVEHVLANKRPLVEFRMSSFLRSLASDEQLTDKKKQILGLLGFYSPLPLPVIGGALGMEPKMLANELEYLIDSSFVYPDSDNHYSIASPIIEAVFRIIPITQIDHAKAVAAMDDYVSDRDTEGKLLPTARSLYKAQVFANREHTPNAVRLTGDLSQIVATSYHARDYDSTIKHAQELVRMRPELLEARMFLTRALVKKERHDEALDQIARISEAGALQEAYFLEGFLKRQQENYRAAIIAYHKSIERGRRGVSIYRELAQCYFEEGNFDEARKYIDKAQRQDPDNRFVVDLQIQIATRQGDEETAKDRLAILEQVDTVEFYQHRRSIVEYSFGDKENAYTASKEAYRQSRRPTLALLTQLIKCEIETGRLDDAGEHIRIMENRYAGIQHDIRTGIKCKWETAKEEYNNALVLWQALRRKDKPVHMALKIDILRGMIRDKRNRGEEVDVAEIEELEKLERRLGAERDKDIADLWLTFEYE